MITIKNLTIHIAGEALFEKVSFGLHRGDRIGLVGPNGSGKSTLLKAIIGEVEIESGSIKVEKENIGYLPQEIVFKNTDTLESFLGAVDKKILDEVGIGGIRPDFSVGQMSGGQKTRMALAKILRDKPSVLLLDEPTNHLDLDAVHWLEKFINDFNGAVLIVSHDRRLLDNTVHKILEIDPVNNTFNEYSGGYSDYIVERKKRMESQETMYRLQQKEKKRLEGWLAIKRQEAHIYSDPRKGKMIRAKERYLEREIYEKEIARPDSFKKIKNIDLSGDVADTKLVLRCDKVSKNFEEKRVLREVSFEMRGKERILLLGNNGSGKTTLLKVITGEISPDGGEIKVGANISMGYFSQEHESLDKNKTVLEEFTNTKNLITGQDPRSILGSFLFSGQAVFKKVESLSLGERVRLIFAKLTNQHNDLLILDEPTNHLDIQSREVIEKALGEYQGAVLAVSHDRYFVEKIGITRRFKVKNGILEEKN